MLTYPDDHFSADPTTGLVVLPRFPDTDTGTGQRSLLIIEAASRLGPVHVVLLDGNGPIEELEARPGIVSVRVLHSDQIAPTGLRQRLLGPTRLALPKMGYAVDPVLRDTLNATIRDAGIRYVIFRYARLFCAAGLEDDPSLRVLVDVDDRDDQKYASRLARKFGPGFARFGLIRGQIGRLERVLRVRLERAALVWFTSQEDAWPSLWPRTAILANSPYFAPARVPGLDPESQTLLFVGSHGHIPNRDGVRWFLESCWPGIRARCPQAQVRIVGSGNWPDLEERFRDLEGVTFVGRVEDLAREYAAARLCICPVREGGGSKIKVVEAAAFARPVVATSHALRGFDGLADLATRADTIEETVTGTCKYLCDPERARADGMALKEAQKALFSRNKTIAGVASEITLALNPAMS